MPFGLYHHSMVSVKNHVTFVIGGQSYSFVSAQSFVYDHIYQVWSNGPSLILPRHSFAVGVVTDNLTKQEYIFVTGGKFDATVMSSTEFLMEHLWQIGKSKTEHTLFIIFTLFNILGPELPTQLYGHSMVSLGFGQAILGGANDFGYQRKIYGLTCSNQIFDISVLSQDLSVPRMYFVAILVPDTISGCVTESKFF